MKMPEGYNRANELLGDERFTDQENLDLGSLLYFCRSMAQALQKEIKAAEIADLGPLVTTIDILDDFAEWK